MISTIFWKELLAVQSVNVHFFRGIQKSFPTTRTTTTTNRTFLRPRQRNLAVKNELHHMKLSRHPGTKTQVN